MAVVAGAEFLLAAAASVSEVLTLPPLLAYCVGFAAVCGSVLAVAAHSPPFGRRALGLLAVPLGAVWLVGQARPGPLPEAVVVTASILLGASLLGTVIGRAIEHPGYLVFVAVVSSAADIFSVYHPAGPSQAIAGSEAALSLLALPWPMLGTGQIEAYLGAGDVVFTAIYGAAARVHGLSLGRTWLALGLAYGMTLLAVIALAAPVPALPLLGLCVVAAHPMARRPPPEEGRRGVLAAALIVAAVAALMLV
ncbi:MAG: hypothetical protein OEZ06_00480 [Myxococcales bacterium]|nr:hypothetical protein [Myxococcales bacterium]